MSLAILKQYKNLFWSKVNKSANCWNWKPSTGTRGYGIFRKVHDRTRYFIRAHRAAFMLNYDTAIPEGYYICHKCDNPTCARPNHLFMGLPKDNSLDMVAKKRSVRKLGSQHGRSKLMENDIVIIRTRISTGENSSSISKDFPVSARMIRRIREGRNWKHV